MNSKVKLSSRLAQHMMQKMVLVNANPSTDYQVIEHMEGVRTNHGNFVKVITHQNPNFDCEAHYTLRHKETGETTDVILYYITTNNQSASITAVDLDTMVKNFNTEALELVCARSIIRPISEVRLKKLIDQGAVKTNEHNVMTTFAKYAFPIF